VSSSRALEEAAAQENNIISNAFFYLVAGSKVPKPKTSTSRRRAGRRRRGEREAEKLRYMPRSPVWPDGNCAWRRGRGRYYQSVSKMRPEQGARHMVQGPSHTFGDAFVGLNATVSRGTESHFRLGIFLSIHRFLNYIDT
jgi:hypothetical protein